MATTPVPNPMLNNTGVQGSGNFNGGAMFSTSGGFQTPSTGVGGPGNMNYGNGMNPAATFGAGSTGSSPAGTAPTATAATASTTGQPQQTSAGSSTTGSFIQPYQDQGGMSVSSANNPYGETEGQQYWQLKYLSDAYGPMGAMIYQYLNSNGGYNSQVTQQTVDATTNAMGRQTQQGANALTSSLASQGVSGSSSTMGDALGAYENQATAQQNAITAQDYYNMWNQSQQNEENMIQFAAKGTGAAQANKPTAMDYLGMGLQLVGDVFGISSGAGGMGGGGGGGGGSVGDTGAGSPDMG